MDYKAILQIKRKNPKCQFIYLCFFWLITFLLEYYFYNILIAKSIEISSSFAFFKVKHSDFLTKYTQVKDIRYLVMLGVFLFSPLNQAYTLLNAIIYSSYIENVLKLLYGHPPLVFNTSNDLLFYFTNGSESPSTKLLCITCFLLSLWKLFVKSEYLKHNQWVTLIKYIFLFLITLFICLLALIEIIFQIHSLNKIIYGICIGFSIYYIIFEIFAFQDLPAKEFFGRFKYKGRTLLLKFSYLAEMLLLLYLYYSLRKEFNFIKPLSLKSQLVNTVDQVFMRGLCIFALLGACFGMEYLYSFCVGYCPQKYNEINEWNKVPIKILLFIIIILSFYSFTLLLSSLIPLESPFEVIILLKTCFPHFIIPYALFGPAITSCIVLLIANNMIYENKDGSYYREEGLEMRLTDNVMII